MNKNQPLIALHRISKKFQMGMTEHVILHAISLHVDSGDMLAIVGASGSGKSTLMNIIGLLDTADEGQYVLKGQCVMTMTSDQLAILRNQYLGFVFQQFHLLPRLSILDNVALPLTYRHLSSSKRKALALDALHRVGMQRYNQHKPMQLSGGQQQRVAIARALVGESQIILADEPTGALDTKTGQEIMALFFSLNKEGKTFVIVTHDQHIAHACNKQIQLSDGSIVV